MKTSTLLDDEKIQRLRDDLLDSLDEELEMSIDEEGGNLDRIHYFRELLRLQGELVKLQDWVVATKQKVVILFEGRDAAGKGGVIKRITQRLTCVSRGRPARSQRPRKNAVVLSALCVALACRRRNSVV